MDRDTDVLRTLRWGLRKYAWVILVPTAVVGVVLPLIQAQQPDVYEATAEVTYDGELLVPNIDPLPRAGETVFGNGAVADGVRRVLGQDAQGGVIPQKVELVAQQDNVVFTVIGRDDDAKTAQELANTAATIFAVEMSRLPLADNGFTQTSPAVRPTAPEAALTDGPVALFLAYLAGVIAGLGVIMLLLMRRRPVLDAVTASEVAGAPVLGSIRLPHRASGNAQVGGMAPLARHLLASGTDMVLLAGPPAGSADRQRLSKALTEVLRGQRRVRLVRGGELDASHPDTPAAPGDSGQAAGSDERSEDELVIVDGPTPLEQAVRPEASLLLVVVPEGISTASLQEVVDDHLSGSGTGVVMVRHERRRILRFRRDRVARDRGSDDQDQGQGEDEDDGSFIERLSGDDDARSEPAEVAGETRSPVR